MKTAKIGSSIKTIDRNGKENFFTVEMMRGDIALVNKNGTLAMTRVLKDDGTFTVYGNDYKIQI